MPRTGLSQLPAPINGQRSPSSQQSVHLLRLVHHKQHGILQAVQEGQVGVGACNTGQKKISFPVCRADGPKSVQHAVHKRVLRQQQRIPGILNPPA